MASSCFCEKNKLLEYCKPYDRLIFGIADTTPSDADFRRIEYIQDKICLTNSDL